jgi:hypothetical protein
LDHRNPVIYCQEQARNLSPYDRPISWNEHVTFGPPFLESNTTVFDMPATQAKVCPPNYSEKIFLQPDREFTWPRAPRKGAGHADLRTTPDEVFGHYTAQLLDPALDIAFVSASNPRQRLLVVYAFRRADFPWVGNWEERNNRPAPPWNGRTFCRGIEFSTTPFALPRRETVDQGRLFDEPTFRWLPGGSTRKVRFIIMLSQVPEDFAGVKQLTIERGLAMIADREPSGHQVCVAIRNFL